RDARELLHLARGEGEPFAGVVSQTGEAEPVVVATREEAPREPADDAAADGLLAREAAEVAVELEGAEVPVDVTPVDRIGEDLCLSAEPELAPDRAPHGWERPRGDAARVGRKSHAGVRHRLYEDPGQEPEEEEEDAVPEQTAPLHEPPRSTGPCATWNRAGQRASRPRCPSWSSSPRASACPAGARCSTRSRSRWRKARRSPSSGGAGLGRRRR